MILRPIFVAKIKAPRVRRHPEDSGDEYDLDSDQGSRGTGGRPGRVILLGNGTELLTDNDEADGFDNDDEEKGRGSQVKKSPLDSIEDDDEAQKSPESTSGLLAHLNNTVRQTSNDPELRSSSDVPPLLTVHDKPGSLEHSEAGRKPISVNALPEKLVSPTPQT